VVGVEGVAGTITPVRETDFRRKVVVTMVMEDSKYKYVDGTGQIIGWM
jgi:hypothetical protein